MLYRKFTADRIFTGTSMLGPGFVLITDSTGKVEGLLPQDEAGEDVEKINGLISPGFVNCHCHLELSHLAGHVPEKTGLVPFLLSVMKTRTHQHADLLASMWEAEKAMYESGISAVGDICNTTDSLVVKKTANLLYHNFIEVTGVVGADAQNRFQHARRLQEMFGERSSVVPHAPYSCSTALFERIEKEQPGGLLTMHNQESEQENRFFYDGTGDFVRLYNELNVDLQHFSPSGKSSLLTCMNRFSAGQSLILVHNVATSRSDLNDIYQNQELHRMEIHWCLCPNANLYIGGKLPDIDLIRSFSSFITVGTDSLASNHELNILSELKTIQGHYPLIPLTDLFRWATLNGARALRMDQTLGSLERGKAPGIIQIQGIEEEKITVKATSVRLL